MKAATHPRESERLAALHRYDVLDTPHEGDFDEVVEVLSAICEAPISVINLIDADRQWFKAEVGLGVRETPLPTSICAHAILQPGLFIVRDMLEDARFRDNPLVAGAPHLRFYAGALLETDDHLPLGTVCILDYKPRELDERQKRAIQLMARQVMRHLELRRFLAAERTARLKAEALVEQNNLLVREVDHRVKNSLQIVSSLLALQARQSGNSDVKAQLFEAESRVRAVAAVHEQLYRAGESDRIPFSEFLAALCRKLSENIPANVESVRCAAQPATMDSDKAVALGLIVNELVNNAFKHAFPADRRGTIRIEGVRRDEDYCLTVSDDGVGMPTAFDPKASTGLGMRVLHALLERVRGRLEIGAGVIGVEVQVCFPAPA